MCRRCPGCHAKMYEEDTSLMCGDCYPQAYADFKSKTLHEWNVKWNSSGLIPPKPLNREALTKAVEELKAEREVGGE